MRRGITSKSRLVAAALVAVLVVVGVLVAGSGEEDAEPKKEPKVVVEEYLGAIASGNGKAACDLMSKETRTAFIRIARLRTNTNDCPKALVGYRRQIDPRYLDVIRKARVESVQVKGDKATAIVRATTGGQATKTPTPLVKEDGEWRVANPVSPRG